MPLSLKNRQMRPQEFFVDSLENTALREKNVLQNIYHLICDKKVTFIFVSRRPLPLKRDLAPRNGFVSQNKELKGTKAPLTLLRSEISLF